VSLNNNNNNKNNNNNNNNNRFVQRRLVVTSEALAADNVSVTLPYGITQCYLPADTSEHAPP